MNRNDVIKGLQCCLQGRNGADCECGSCPYIKNTLECKETLAADALEYIQHSEEVRADLVERMDELLATVKDMPDVVRCCECKYGKSIQDADAHEYIQCTNKEYPAANVETWPLDLDWYCAGGERK